MTLDSAPQLRLAVIGHGWLAMALGVAVVGTAYFALPTGTAAQISVMLATSVGAAGLLAWRLVREGVATTLPWALWLGAVTLYALATSVWALWPAVTGRSLPFPSPVDGLYFTSYLLSAAFLVSLLRRRYLLGTDAARETAVALVDAAIFAVALLALLWPVLIGPSLEDPTVTALTSLTAVGYPLLTAVVVGLVAQLGLAGRHGTTAQGLLLVWAGAELAGDVFYGYFGATGAFYYGHPISLAWLASYVALGVLALTPRLADLTRHGAARAALHGPRLWIPLAAALIPGVVAYSSDSWLLDALTGIGILLVIARLRLVSGDLAEQRRLGAALSRMADQLAHQATHDPLTGLANRALFTSQLEQAWAHHHRHGRGLAVLAVDLDGFKAVNDRHGHHAGDALLVEVARRLEAAVRDSDVLARVGGDEFTVLLPEADLAAAREVADRILEALSADDDASEAERLLSASVGVATSHPRQRDADDLLREADAAMFAAKAAGKGRQVTFAEGLEPASGVTLPDVVTHDARAWAAYVHGLRTEIAARKEAGELPKSLRAPSGLQRTLERLLQAIEELPTTAHRAPLTLPPTAEMEEFVFHHTAVQHYVDALVAQGRLNAQRPAAAARFWDHLQREVVAARSPRP